MEDIRTDPDTIKMRDSVLSDLYGILLAEKEDMMITVAILINGQPIMARSAYNANAEDLEGRTRYKCDDGSLIYHYRDDGAVVLAKKLLDTIKNT